MTDKKPKKKPRIKIRSPRKVFGTAVSRGPNEARIAENNEKEKDPTSDKDDPARWENKPRFAKFSAVAGHALTKQLDGTLDFEEGTTQWWGMRAMKGYGPVFEKDYNVSSDLSKEEYKKKLRDPIPLKALEAGQLFRQSLYERLYDVNDIIKTIWLNRESGVPGVMMCFDMFAGIYKAPKGFIPMPKFWERSHGSHSVFAFGYDYKKRFIKFVNSWGGKWGDSGHGYLSFDYIEKYLVECWAAGGRYWHEELRNDRGTTRIDNVDYELSVYHPIVYGRQPLWVCDAYIDKKIVGWTHFRFNDEAKSILLEEIFVMPNFRKKRIGKQLLATVENIAWHYIVPKIIGYIHIQDLLFPETVEAVEGLFTSEHYKFIPNRQKKFRGCMYQVIRDDILNGRR
jgi:GNAT superfamily N-acetyltransferase